MMVISWCQFYLRGCLTSKMSFESLDDEMNVDEVENDGHQTRQNVENNVMNHKVGELVLELANLAIEEIQTCENHAKDDYVQVW